MYRAPAKTRRSLGVGGSSLGHMYRAPAKTRRSLGVGGSSLGRVLNLRRLPLLALPKKRVSVVWTAYFSSPPFVSCRDKTNERSPSIFLANSPSSRLPGVVQP
jgi:hypothetical protein